MRRTNDTTKQKSFSPWRALLLVGPLLAASLGLLVAKAQAADAQVYAKSVKAAIDYLRDKGQSEDGSFTKKAGVGVTALVTTGLLQNGVPVNDPMVVKALAYLEKNVQPDGGIYTAKLPFNNYETCLAIMCLHEANGDGDKYTKAIETATSYIKKLQWDEEEQKEPSDVIYGGAGYGMDKRPDLSNTAFFLDALKGIGTDSDDPAIQKALAFVSRCQNLETEHNTTPFAAKNPDGGFYYTPVGEGSSQAGKTEAGGLRSYGVMTYAGLKSMLYAGLTADDPRVKAASTWIAQHYSLKENPGLGDAGLYYYYQTFAKTMAALGNDEFVDASGKKHDWKHEMLMEMASRQRADGSWANGNDKWMEGDANLATGYALLVYGQIKPEGADKGKGKAKAASKAKK